MCKQARLTYFKIQLKVMGKSELKEETPGTSYYMQLLWSERFLLLSRFLARCFHFSNKF